MEWQEIADQIMDARDLEVSKRFRDVLDDDEG
jgi:hypothetical protein